VLLQEHMVVLGEASGKCQGAPTGSTRDTWMNGSIYFPVTAKSNDSSSVAKASWLQL